MNDEAQGRAEGAAAPAGEPQGGQGGQEAGQGAGPFRMEIEAPRSWERVVKVQVERSHYEHEYAAKLRAAVRQHEAPGFRKGKVPRARVERDLGDRLRVLAMQAIVPEAFKAAIVEHQLVPITDPEVGNIHIEEDKPVRFDLHFEVRPRPVARDYEGLPLQKPRLEVRDEEVAEVLERLRDSRAIWERADRAAVPGDRLRLDLVPLRDGRPDEEAAVKDQRLLLGAAANIETFEEALRGAEAGQERRVEVTYPPDHQNEELRGRTVTYLCRVGLVEAKTLPELNDAFAATLEPGQTVLGLRQAIRQDLQLELEHRLQRELEEQAVDRLLERNEIEVPPSLLRQYIEGGLEELHGRNAQIGRASTPAEDADYRRLTRPIAERILKGMFIMDAIRRQEGLTVGEQDVEGEIEAVARRHGFDLQKYREYAAEGSERERIRHALEERKAFEFLLGRARIEEVDPEEYARQREAEAARAEAPAPGGGPEGGSDAAGREARG